MAVSLRKEQNAFGFLTELVNFGAYDWQSSPSLELLLEWDAEEGHSGLLGPTPSNCLSDYAILTKHHEDGHFWRAEKHALFFMTSC